MAITHLPVEALRKGIDPNSLPFETTDELSPLETIIGQDRALKALQLGLEIKASGYNIFVTGISGTGRTTIIEKILHQHARQREVPEDWCYVYNFADPDCPQAISLPAGKGKLFRQNMDQLISTLRKELRRVFASDRFGDQKSAVLTRINSEKRQLLEDLENAAAELDLKIEPSSMGFQTIILRNGQPLSAEQVAALSAEEKEEISHRVQKIERHIAETLRQLARLDIRAQKTLNQLNRDVAAFVVDQYVKEILDDYRDFPEVSAYLQKVGQDVVRNSSSFFADEEVGEGERDSAPQQQFQKRYQVNVVVDNSHLEGAPVIYETNPTFNNLMGRIEKYPVSGSYMTDFTMIKAGSLLKANGGYLMADALEVLQNPYAFEALKRSLRNKEVRIEDITEVQGLFSVASLKPEPIPLKIKVVLIGWNDIYRRLNSFDGGFSKIFKIRADFDYEADCDQQTLTQYSQFIKRIIDEEKLPPFHRSAVEEIIQYGHRLAGDQQKISLEFGQIIRVIQQAAYWAAEENGTLVQDRHVLRAIDEMDHRHSLYKEKVQEYIRRDIQKIVVKGNRVGEINGLSVLNLGDYSFGKPNRITAKTYIGSENLVSIERKAGLSGKIHDKGSYILSGFFHSLFGEYIPVSFSASIAFEQSYGKIDGDSASSTELYALLSALSETPVKQGIAVTGSVNQNGEVQAIGGVNEKVEGFFEVCSAKGLTGDQGVTIPRANLPELALRPEVREAVMKKQFHIWAVDHVADGLELLTGLPAGVRNKKGHFPRNSIFGKVEKRLREFAMRSEAYRKSLSEKKKKAAKTKNAARGKSPKKSTKK